MVKSVVAPAASNTLISVASTTKTVTSAACDSSTSTTSSNQKGIMNNIETWKNEMAASDAANSTSR
jgi:hypothetical protein